MSSAIFSTLYCFSESNLAKRSPSRASIGITVLSFQLLIVFITSGKILPDVIVGASFSESSPIQLLKNVLHTAFGTENS